MDIVIKSCNRPHYLDKCLSSVKRHLVGDLNITVVDDGTPSKYLEKIRQRHPDVVIQLTKAHPWKSRENAQGLYMSKAEIPWDEWREPVLGCSEDYFMLLEDDQWVSHRMEIADLVASMRSESILMARLSHSSCGKFNKGKVVVSDADMVVFEPWIIGNWLRKLSYSMFMEVRSKGRRILKWLHAPVDEWLLNGYAIYVVCGAIYEKEYWLGITDRHGGVIDEHRQLRRAVKDVLRRRIARFAYSNDSWVHTTFQSACSGKYIDDRTGFHTPKFNRLLSEAWLEGRLDEAVHMNGDFAVDLVEDLLNESKEPELTPSYWSKWRSAFARPYAKVGIDVG